ncbi:MAG: hypothetical protein IPG11_12965 [Flavobacteriales bacterium]|nr:hypothetical protein [Flavobacteriales bacterium]
MKGEVVNNFTDARVVDVLMFLCKRYDLDVEFIGSIIVLKPYVPVAPPVQPPPPPRTGPSPTMPIAAWWTWTCDATHYAVARAINPATGAMWCLRPGLEDSWSRSSCAAVPCRAPWKIGLRQQPHHGAHQGRYLPIAWPGGVFTETIGPQCAWAPGATAGNFGVALRDGDRVVVDAHNIPMEQIGAKASTLLDRQGLLPL